MVNPLLLALAGGTIAKVGSTLYAGSNNRRLYTRQKADYDRQVRDWNKSFGYGGKRHIKYPSLAFEGRSLAVDNAIRNSYAVGVSSAANGLTRWM